MDFLSSLHYWPRTYIQSGCVAFLIAVAGMPLAIFILRRFRIMDAVHADKLHAAPVPRGGGIVIFIAFSAGVLWPYYLNNPFKGVLLGAGICLVVGAVDDLRGGIPAILKFATLVVVTIIMSRYGVVVKLFQNYPIDLLITILWVGGVTSAFNAMDNMDGLASGIAAIAAAMFFVVALQAFFEAGTQNSLSWFGLLAAGLIGANLGFLVYNFRPAHIFMGDSGSFFMGFVLAALGVMGEWSENRVVSSTIPMLILGVPILDFAYVLATRIFRGDTKSVRQIIEHCALDHLSHRLLWMGFGQTGAVLVVYLICIVFGVTGVLLSNSTSVLDSSLALLQGLLFAAIVVALMTMAERRHRGAIQQAGTRRESD